MTRKLQWKEEIKKSKNGETKNTQVEPFKGKDFGSRQPFYIHPITNAPLWHPKYLPQNVKQYVYESISVHAQLTPVG